MILDAASTLPVTPLAPENYLNQFAQPALNKTEFLTIGYGTEVRRTAETGPQAPLPQRQPIVRRYTTEIGQKLTVQILQMNGNEHDPRAGGGTCFGDSGGPAIHGGYVVGDTSYGYTNNCRYLGGYQRVDTPVVRNLAGRLPRGSGVRYEGVTSRTPVPRSLDLSGELPRARG